MLIIVGGHQNHDVRPSLSEAAMWDCGDDAAYDSSAFWADHKGVSEITEEDVLKDLPSEVHRNATIVYNKIGKYLHSLCLELESSGQQDIFSYRKLASLLQIIEWKPFTYHISQMLLSIYPSVGQTDHECFNPVYISNGHKDKWSDSLHTLYINRNLRSNISETNNKHFCTWTLLAMILKLRVNTFPDSMVLMLFENIQFVALLSLTNIMLYEHINLTRHTKENLIQYGLQTLNKSNLLFLSLF